MPPKEGFFFLFRFFFFIGIQNFIAQPTPLVPYLDAFKILKDYTILRPIESLNAYIKH